jgi:beta-lactamase regulating signal transducer with metallopeptidase domain
MIPVLTFSIIAAGLVFLAGRKDAARDPRLTVLLLILLSVFPLMLVMMPKIAVLPAAGGTANAARFPSGMIVAVIWAAGFSIALSRLAFAAWTLRCWRDRSALVDRVAGVEIRELRGLQGPVAAGVFRPVIFFPSTWREWSEARRQLVLEHELAHHRRRDPLSRLFVELACALHWYHPLVRWMARRFILQCEFACDAMVLRKGVDAKKYATLLCDFAENRSASRLALSMAETSSLEARVRRMLKPASGFSSAALLTVGGLGLMAACLLSMIGQKVGNDIKVPAHEVELRLTADPFPGEDGAP